MKFRKTTEADIPAVLAIYDGARETMHAAGIPQWLDGYPSEKDLRSDMAHGYSYVLTEDDGTVVATAAVVLDGEPTYDGIRDGAWLTESTAKQPTYGAVHRVACAKNLRSRGIATCMMGEAEQCIRAHGMRSVRIDTHRQNQPMQRMLARNRFTYCGEITISDGTPRIAFEKLL